MEEEIEIEKNRKSLGHAYFFVFVHGVYGKPKDWNIWNETIVRKWSRKKNVDLFVLNSKSNSSFSGTTKGMKHCGQNLAKEILEYYENYLSNIKCRIFLSFITFSLGGVIARSAIGELYMNNRDIFRKLIPHSYYSFATPHLGVKKPGGGLKKNVFKFFVNTVSCRAFTGKSGKELLIEDEDKLFLKMSEFNSPYMKGLRMFPNKTLVGSSHFDIKVPFSSALIRPFNPYPFPQENKYRLRVLGAHNFPESHIVYSMCRKRKWKLSRDVTGLNNTGNRDASYIGDVVDLENGIFRDNNRTVRFPLRLLAGLQRIKWRRLDIEFSVGKNYPRYEIHLMYILKKRVPGVEPSRAYKASLEAINFFCDVVLFDHGIIQNSEVRLDSEENVPTGVVELDENNVVVEERKTEEEEEVEGEEEVVVEVKIEAEDEEDEEEEEEQDKMIQDVLFGEGVVVTKEEEETKPEEPQQEEEPEKISHSEIKKKIEEEEEKEQILFDDGEDEVEGLFEVEDSSMSFPSLKVGEGDDEEIEEMMQMNGLL